MKKANKFLLLTVAACFFAASVFGQANTEKRVIEVTGSAETLITPNEFIFKITLLERIENKQKLTIEMQEANLRRELTNLGVEVAKDLTIFDLNSFYIDRKKTKDTLASKDYRLKLNDLAKIERLQEIADRLNVSRLELIESTHTELTRFRRETKMEVVKAAKAKAEYMLGAIGEKVGKTVFIQEIPDEKISVSLSNSVNATLSVRSNGRFSSGNARQTDDALTFSKIELQYVVLARFEIE